MRMRCTVCNWIYDESVEEVLFAELPNSYTCPVCGAPKSAFVPTGQAELEGGPTVAEALVGHLVSIGVTRVYGIPGDSNLPFIEAVRQHPGIELVMTRHEQTAAFMASAHAKLTGELGVCVSIAGPGATNLMTGLMDAASDRAPVLALVGQVAGIYLGSEGFQEIDQIEMFRSFAAFAETLSIPSQLPRLFGMAVKSATKQGGVAVLSMPTDTLGDRAAEEAWDPARRLFNPKVIPSEVALDEAARRINEAEAPAIFAGWGCRGASDVLERFVDHLGAPVATTSRAKGVLPETGPPVLGVMGSIGNPFTPGVLASSDLLIVLGTGFRQRNLLAEVPILQVDHDPVRLGRNFDVAYGLVGDVEVTLEALLPRLERREMSPEMKKRMEEARASWARELDEAIKDEGDVHPARVVRGLQKVVDPDAVMSVDVGDHTYWLYRYFQTQRQLTLMSASMASMAFSLPAALAGALAMPEREVVCVTGDGGFSMLMADFTTAVRENLNVKVIVFNDGCLKNIKKEQKRDGYPFYGVDFVNPDFAQFAESAGALGLSIETNDEIDAVLEEAFAHKGPVLVDIAVDPDVMLPGVKTLT